MKKIASDKNYILFKRAWSYRQWSDNAKRNHEMSGKNCNQINPCHEWIRYMELFAEPEDRWTKAEAEEKEIYYICNSSALEAECDNQLFDHQDKQKRIHNLKGSEIRRRMREVKQSLKERPPRRGW
jgi:hypothetical protein